MKYQVNKVENGLCTIRLIAEDNVEKKVLESNEEQDTFLFHYQKALERHVHRDATFVCIVNAVNYPVTVSVKYQITSGIGN